MTLETFNKTIITCKKCPRLRNWAKIVAGRVPDYDKKDYWSRPVPGFGDINAQLLIVGLAPGAHGANRTGRPFTGDIAGDYLFRALYKFGFSSKCYSEDNNDGLRINNVYLTNVVRCAPENDRPNSEEFGHCIGYLEKELDKLPNIKVILVFGELAFNQVKRLLKSKGASTSEMVFTHGGIFKGLGGHFPIVVASYHTSVWNFIYKTMTIKKLYRLFDQIDKLLRTEAEISGIS